MLRQQFYCIDERSILRVNTVLLCVSVCAVFPQYSRLVGSAAVTDVFSSCPASDCAKPAYRLDAAQLI